MGVPPSVLWGRQRRSLQVDGTTIHDPDWLQVDYALLVLLDEYEAGLCICGEPVESHKGKTANDYGGAYLTCPAMEALDLEQSNRARSDGNKEAKPDPSRARAWFVKPIEILRAMAEAATTPQPEPLYQQPPTTPSGVAD